jgi:hypothetical protein
MVSTLARQSGALLGKQTPQYWLWQGRHVKLVDGTTVLMPDTAENQARFPQHGQQEAGVGFPLTRLVDVMDLSNWAVLDAAIRAYQGKGTGEHGLFRELKECFIEGDVMLADGYYCSYFLIADMLRRAWMCCLSSMVRGAPIFAEASNSAYAITGVVVQARLDACTGVPWLCG